MKIFIYTWDELHPLIVHFPIALLLIVPLFIFIGIIYKKYDRCCFLCAFILMLLGTISSIFAVATGEASAQLIDKTPEVQKVITLHWQLAEITRTLFIVLTIIYAIILFAPQKFLKKPLERKQIVIINIIFLIVLLAGCVLLSYTGHLGGELVHKLGVSSWSSH